MNDDIRSRIETFFNAYPMVKYPKDQILLFPGEKSDKVYHLLSGRVCQYDVSYRGDEVIVNTFKQPAFFPMASAINQSPSNFFYRTELESTVRVAPAIDAVEFLRRSPDVTFDLLGRVYTGIESILQRTVFLMSGTARSRLIFELVVEFRRFGVQSGTSGYLEVTEASIALRSGLSRETVSREIKHLKDKKLVAIQAHRIVIPDITKLEKLLTAHEN